jgi:excisionase family DNA binding protein
MIELTPSQTLEWLFVRRFLGVKEDDQTQDVIGRFAMHYTFPERIRGIFDYRRKVRRSVMSEKSSKEIPWDPARIEREAADDADENDGRQTSGRPRQAAASSRVTSEHGRYSIEEGAALVGITKRTLYRWHREGKLRLLRKQGELVLSDDQLRQAQFFASAPRRQKGKTGKTQAAAKKFIQRRLGKGQTLDQLIKSTLKLEDSI